MAGDFGFAPTDRPDYIFISYNSEDTDRVAAIARRLSYSNAPVWYDKGLEYGEKWEAQISRRIMDARCLLLFFTKGILTKSNSYVKKEYDMATRFFNKPVYVVMLDDIRDQEVPYDKVPWWIDIQDRQSIPAADVTDLDKLTQRILSALGIQSHEEKANALIARYNALFGAGQHEEAEKYLEEYLNRKSVSAKAETIGNMFRRQLLADSPMCRKFTRRTDKPRINHVGELVDSFFESCQLEINGCLLTVGNSIVFHRGNRGDAHVINIWKDDENIHTIGRLIEARSLCVYYDPLDDLLYICWIGDLERMVAGDLETDEIVYVTAIQNPGGHPCCSNFHYPTAD